MVRNLPDEWDRQVDVVVVGSGGAGMVAALTAQFYGAETLVLEKSPRLGGTTAVSQSSLWMPNSRPVLEERGPSDRESLYKYIRRVAGDLVPDDLIYTFIDGHPDVIDFLEETTDLEFQCMPPETFVEYHEDFMGASVEGRSIEPTIYDGSSLKDKPHNVRDSHIFKLPATLTEMVSEGGMYRYAEEMDVDELIARAKAGELAGGRALIGALYERCHELGADFETDAPGREIVMEDNVVRGVIADIQGETYVAANAVVLAAGGMEWDKEMRESFLRGPIVGPASPPYNEGDAIEMGMDVGAKLGNMNEAWWMPTASIPGDEWEDGSQEYRPIVGERSLPGSIMVNKAGKRFCNEAGNYHDVGKRFFDFDQNSYGYKNIPAYVIVDNSYRSRYYLMNVGPSDPDPDWLVTAKTIPNLAAELGIDSEELERTLDRFNEHARKGDDPEFNRGEAKHDHSRGDPEAEHPNLAPVDNPPFYAFEVNPGVIGTKGGVVTNANAEVLDIREEAIPNLYACSNGTAHVMGMGYPASGGTIGPNLLFGYIAGQQAADNTT